MYLQTNQWNLYSKNYQHGKRHKTGWRILWNTAFNLSQCNSYLEVKKKSVTNLVAVIFTIWKILELNLLSSQSSLFTLFCYYQTTNYCYCQNLSNFLGKNWISLLFIQETSRIIKIPQSESDNQNDLFYTILKIPITCLAR